MGMLISARVKYFSVIIYIELRPNFVYGGSNLRNIYSSEIFGLTFFIYEIIASPISFNNGYIAGCFVFCCTIEIVFFSQSISLNFNAHMSELLIPNPVSYTHLTLPTKR